MNTPAIKVLDECPTCPVKGPEVYRAEAHPISCTWAANNTDRCDPHDELLRPGEKECPDPLAPESSVDPHNRRQLLPTPPTKDYWGAKKETQ